MKKSLLSLAVIATLSSSLLASDVRVSGFVNVVGGVNDVNPDKYVANQTSQEYRGYDNQYDFLNETLVGIQFSSNISDKMGATIQLIAKEDPLNGNLQMEWGYISYDATDKLRILAGRIRPALYLYSDYLDVGYAYNWITPPSEVYDQVQITKINGLNASYSLDVGDNQLVTSIYGGNSDFSKELGGDELKLVYDNVAGAEMAFVNDDFKIRAGYLQMEVTDDKNPETTPIELKMTKTDVSFYGVGVSVDYADVIFASEYTVKTVDSSGSPDESAYYAMLGYRMGDFITSYTYANVESDMEVSTSNAVNEKRASKLDDRFSHNIVLRYEINTQAALKVEYNLATKTHSSYATGNLVETDEDISTYRIALNVIF